VGVRVWVCVRVYVYESFDHLLNTFEQTFCQET
jgi:hypothetical protein